MAILILTGILITIAIYLACGFVFAIAFVVKGANVIDEGTHGAPWGFRIIILPASIVFWPLLLRKWIAAHNNEIQ